MAKQLNVNLAFTADTGKAKTQIQELQNLLNQITYTSAATGGNSIGAKIGSDLQQASAAAKELQLHLNNAFNATTGKFDLSLLDKSLKTSGSNLQALSTQLLNAGSTGQQAFLKLAQSISLADQPMFRISNRIREFGTVMKNTIKWQLSSSMIHGFMSTISSAYNYAQDLNASLNDIRIVTGHSANEMARFAEQANKAARRLSTTTTDYTKASLIYYQQGLSDSEVAARTDVTIKMANAAGQSAQTVSDQLTAVWNNFYDGSKSLEYYADVMTALGAATASSTDEISQGLQKFAAVAETVGLSYEYATAALATITSNTRESADVVGTALKTLFARIQGLQLGETLEDGTNLNKYSQALAKVGISIYESNGELKAMDNILNEMAAKWDTMNAAQQTALAQTVAGVRQYTQLIALMENWDKGDRDSFVSNLNTVANAEGTLDTQASIYAESWEAAEKRVRAAAEGIFDSLLDDKFFISLNNGFANALGGINAFIKGLGGVKPLITGIAGIFMTNFAHKIPQALDNLKYNLQMLMPNGTRNAYNRIQSEMNLASQQAFKDNTINKDSSLGYAIDQANKLTAARTKLALVSSQMSDAEKQLANGSLNMISQIQQETIALKQKSEALQENINQSMHMTKMQTGIMASFDIGESIGNKIGQRVNAQTLGLENIDFSTLGGDITASLTGPLMRAVDESKLKISELPKALAEAGTLFKMLGPEFGDAMSNIQEKINNVNADNFKQVKADFLSFTKILPQGVLECENVQKALQQFRNASGPEDVKTAFNQLNEALKNTVPSVEDVERILASIHGDKIHELFAAMRNFSSTTDDAGKKAELLRQMLEGFQPTHVVRLSEAFGALGGMMSNIVTVGRAISSMINTLKDPDASGWEKFSSVLMGLSMILYSSTSFARGYGTIIGFLSSQVNKLTTATALEAAVTRISTEENERNAGAQGLSAAGSAADAEAKGADAAATNAESQATDRSTRSALRNAKTLFNHYKTQIGGYALIAASIALIVGIIVAANNQFNEASKDAENAAVAAAQLAEQYQTAKTNYEALITTTENYESAVESLDSLTKGTAEYNEELIKANEYAMDLINKYDLIGKYSIQGGLIVFDEGVLEEAKNQQLDVMGKAQASSYIGKVAQSHLTGESNQTNLNRNINSSSDNWWQAANIGVTTAGGALAGAGLAVGGAMALGSTIGSVVPIVGTIVGAIIGLIAGGITTAISGAESAAEDAALNNITQYVQKNGNDIFVAESWENFDKMLTDANLEIDDKDLVRSLYENRNAIQELTTAELARLEREETNFEAAFAAYNMGNANYSDLEVGQGYLNEQASNYREENIDRVRSEVDDLWAGSNDDFWAKYLEYVYGQKEIDVNNTSGENVRVRDLGGEGVTIQIKNANGVWETSGDKNGLDEDVAAEQLVNALLLEEASEKMDFGTLHSLTSNLIDAGLTLEKDSSLMDSILSQYAEGGPIDLSKYSYNDIMSIDTTKIQDTEFQEAVDTAIQNYTDGLSEIEQALIAEGYNGLVGQNWTVQIDENSTVESTREALIAAQNYINAHQLTASIQVKNQMISALESGDMATFKELYDQSTFAKLKPYEEAISMSTEDLIRWLQNGGQDLSGAFETTQAALQANTDAINAQTDILNDAKIAAYGKDGEADGIGGSEQVYLEAVQAENDAKQYSHDVVVDAVGWTGINYRAFNGPDNTGFNSILRQSAGGSEVLDIGQTLNQWDALFAGYLGADSPLYNVYSQFTQDAIAYGKAEYGSEDWSNAQNAMNNSWNAFIEAMIEQEINSGQYDTRITEYGEDTVRTELRNQYSSLGGSAYTDSGGWETTNYTMGLELINQILSTIFAAGQNGVGETNYLAAVSNRESAETQFGLDKTAAGNSGAAESNIANLESERTDMLEDLHIQRALMTQEVSDYGLDPEVYEELKRQIAATNKELQGQEGILHKLAVAQLRAERGAKKMAENQEDWRKTIQESNGEGTDYLQTVVDIRDAYADVFDLDPSMAENLTAEFLTSETAMNLMTEALNGNEEAWDDWKFAVADALISDEMEGEVTGIVNNTLNGVLQQIAEFNFEEEGIEIGASVEDTAFWAALDGMKIGSAEAAQAISSALSSMGVDAQIIKHVQYADGSTQSYTASGDWFDPATGEITPVDASVEESRGDATYTWYTLEGATYNGKGVSPPSGSSPPKGGGGGGGKKPKKAKEVKKTDVVDRYKEIGDKMDDLAESMNDASEAADRMYGNDRIKQMEKVNKLLKDEIGLIEKKKEEAQAYLQEDRDTLNQAAAEAGVSFTFDENDNITNYTTEMTKLFEELDSAIKSANADGDASEDEQEAIDKIQERIDKVKEAIEQYDETKELIEDLDNDIQEKLYSIYDNELEAFEYKVELDLELSEDSMKIIEFQMSQIEDDAFKAAESIALTSQKAENLYDTLMTNRDALDEAFGLSDIAWDLGIMQEGQEFTEAQINLMKEYRDNIMDVIGEMSELRETVEGQVMEVFDAWNEKLETNMDTLDHFGSILDSYKNIVDIVGQDTMGLSEEFMQNMQNASVEHALDQMHATKEAYETMMSARLRAEQALEDARARGDDTSAKMWEETLTELNSNMESAQEDMLSSWENALSVIQDNFEATVERVVEAFNNAVYAFGGMEGLSNEFSRQKEMADLMVDDYQKIYELSKLNRNIQKTLDDTDVIAGKQKLLKLQEKINALEEEGVELSQYDLEYLQAEYELRMAEVELANAQAKKDTVRLSKDNEGNWSYIYTTSVDAVDEAHQKYEDALYAMQELSSNYVDEMSEQLISTSQEMAEALAEVRASDFASQEDYEKELDRIRKMYQERLDQQEAELQKSINNNKDLYTQDWTNYHEATGYKISDTENFVTSFKDTLLGALMDSESDTANFNNIMSSSVDILTTGLVDAAATYYSHMEQAMQAAGTSTNDFAIDMEENINSVVEQSQLGTEAIEEMAEKMASAFWDITDSVTQWQEGYGTAMQQVIDSNLAVVESFNNMLKELSIDPDSIKVEYDISTDYGLENASSMDTGGYTGTWGAAGKLAILHEKELVLNPDDTSNFLQAIGISKTLLETIDLNAKQASNGMGLLSAAGFRDSNNGTLEQNVHIEATFPNVTDHNEIEEAMKNLVNTASQYANRK